MITVHDVAAYLLEVDGPMSAMKLQKLCFYSQAWHLVWEDRPLFGERFEAWANGPVAPALYAEHRGEFMVSTEPRGDASKVKADATAREDIDLVRETYSPLSAYQLSAATHNEAPWRDARGNLPPGARSNAEISLSAMSEFYGSLI